MYMTLSGSKGIARTLRWVLWRVHSEKAEKGPGNGGDQIEGIVPGNKREREGYCESVREVTIRFLCE